ncbi:CHAT domain-containing protein [Sulfurimonas sp.]|uniref:CHAT domain-containing protein n=1 Tax=Sulfurimonas sp. TaxID=2022749 RepID=UPI002AAFBFDA|nr:CHAT domain-containing protein [Sulfurimonas sp.]
MFKYISLTLLIFLLSGYGGSVAIPQNKIIKPTKVDNIQTFLKIYPKDSVEIQNISKAKLSFPKVGELNSYEITVTPNLEIAYNNYLGGDGQKALKALDTIVQTSKDNKMLWQASMLKMKVLMMMGLGYDAINEAKTCQKYEKLSFNSNLNCIALRGESFVWAGDYKNAKIDLESVLLSIGNWELPTSYMSPPSNMSELVATTTAQLRSYTALAAMYTLKEDYERAYYFANEADKRYNALRFVSNHWLYGQFVKLHLDTYYGDATNLTMLASAQLALDLNKEADENFAKAIAFFDKIRYTKGKATVLALKARVFNRTGQYDKCNEAGKIALNYSLKNGFLDFVWRIEMLRGETFEKLGRPNEAEAAYIRAANTVNSLSSSLASDSSKRKFGFNKDDIVLALIRYDIKKQDYEKLFVDAEESRARAFVDILASRTLNEQNPILKEIYKLDKEINRLIILNTAVGVDNTKGVKKLQTLMQEKEKKKKELKVNNAKLSSVVSVWSSSLKQTQKSLGENSLIYFLPVTKGEKITYLSISNSSYSFEHLDITYEELGDNLKELSDLLGIDSSKTRGLQKLLTKSSIKKPNSIDTLIKKLTLNFTFKTKSKNIFIVANKDTNFIPWGMLDIEFTPLLLPTASWINLKDVKINSNKAVIIGNPNFGGDAVQLQGAQNEAIALAKVYNQKALLNADATKANMREAIGKGVNVLHFATHGLFVKNEPLKSVLLLSDGKKADALSADEIFSKPLKANLVVLSACESGLGSSASANDYLGLSRSFFLGGSKAVLSSLWAIDDEGTKEFMITFHSYAKDGNYAKGYKMARDSLKDKGYSPSIYGAFILQGMDK